MDAALGQGLEAVYEWSFRLGPGFVVGVGNGLILGWLMYKSELVPRGLAMFGLIGGPLIIIAGVLVMFDVIEAGGSVQGLMTIPEAFWELSLGIYLVVKGLQAVVARAHGARGGHDRVRPRWQPRSTAT